MRMRIIITILSVALISLNLLGQNEQSQTEGSVSYVTSQSVYVKFESTEGIQVGDTIKLVKDGKLIPALVVTNSSSISVVGTPIEGVILNTGDKVQAKVNLMPEVETAEPTEQVPAIVIDVTDSTKMKAKTEEELLNQERIRGRVRVASYSNYSNTGAPFNQRMRYTFTLNAEHINNSKTSVDTYISFIHSNQRWNEIQENVFNGLKIYNLAVTYDFNSTTRTIIGRKINQRMANAGAIDGLQFEKMFGKFTGGLILGSRPDYQNYGFNFDLLQYGAYLSHDLKGEHGLMQNTVSFLEQTNNGNTDRRFAYLQHSNALVKNIYFFASLEVDLYKKVNEVAQSTFDLTNMYFMLRYRPVRQLSLSASYSARNNIVYYETFKSFIDKLIETETLQGWRLQVNYRPLKFLSVGVNGGYRSRPSDPNPSRNLYGYVTYTRVPGIDASVTLSATLLETAYLTGNIYSIALNRDIIPGKLFGGFSYRMVDYKYINYEINIAQSIADLNLTWKLNKKFSFGANYEGTFEKPRTYNRLYANISYRF